MSNANNVLIRRSYSISDLNHDHALLRAAHLFTSHIALEDAVARYELNRIDFSKTEQQSPSYIAINPKARVPAMITPRGVLTETPAMLAFIAQSFSEARLPPLDNSFAFAEVQAFNSYLCSTLYVAHAHRMRGHRWVDDPAAIVAMQKKVPPSVGACYDLIERQMLRVRG